MTTTDQRARSRFLLEVTLDQERLKARIAAKLRAHRLSLRPPEGLPQLDYRDLFVHDGKAVSYRQYQRWEAGDSMPEWKWIEVIAEVLGVSQQELLADDGEESAETEEVTEAGAAGDEEARWEQVLLRLRRIEEALSIPQDDPAVPQPGRAANGH